MSGAQLKQGGFCPLYMRSPKAPRAPGLVRQVSKVMGQGGPCRKCLLTCLVFLLGCLEIDFWSSQQNYEMKSCTIGHFREVEHRAVSLSFCTAQQFLKRLLGWEGSAMRVCREWAHVFPARGSCPVCSALVLSPCGCQDCRSEQPVPFTFLFLSTLLFNTT